MILPIERALVYLFGHTPSEDERHAFVEHELDLQAADSLSSVLPRLSFSRALVFHATTANVVDILNLFDECAVEAALHGNILIPCSDEAAVRSRLLQHILSDSYANVVNGKREYPDFITYLFLYKTNQVLFSELAKFCGRWDAGPSAKSPLTINGTSYSRRDAAPTPASLTKKEEDTVLLQRAFGDCRCIRTEELESGKSDATVLKVHPELQAPAYGASTRPMYAKLDSLLRIKQEVEKYDLYVESAIPFFMRPNLVRSRCVMPGQGYTRGIIVGNFVEHSEPLIKAIERGSANLAIYSLFDNAFRTWRVGSRDEISISIVESLDKAGFARRMSSSLKKYLPIANSYGLEREPTALLAMLRNVPVRAHRVGTIHGDLHPDNVHVRGIDAVLLDFYTVREGPLVYDLANLEIAIVFRAYSVSTSGFDNWKSLVDKLYVGDAFLHPPEPTDHGHALENLWIAVRQLRSISATIEKSGIDYPVAIAFCLLRNCTYDSDSPLRTAYGLFAAERLISHLVHV